MCWRRIDISKCAAGIIAAAVASFMASDLAIAQDPSAKCKPVIPDTLPSPAIASCTNEFWKCSVDLYGNWLGYVKATDGTLKCDAVPTLATCNLSDIRSKWLKYKAPVVRNVLDAPDLRTDTVTRPPGKNLQEVIQELESATKMVRATTGIKTEAEKTFDAFGLDDATRKTNLLGAITAFNAAKDKLEIQIRVIAASADSVCDNCFALGRWNVLKTAVDEVYRDRPASGKEWADRWQDRLNQPPDDSSIPIKLDEITDQALKTDKAKTLLKYVKWALCENSNIDPGQKKSEAVGSYDGPAKLTENRKTIETLLKLFAVNPPTDGPLKGKWTDQDNWVSGELKTRFGGAEMPSILATAPTCDPSIGAVVATSRKEKKAFCRDPDVQAVMLELAESK